jgi:hypothetical protein
MNRLWKINLWQQFGAAIDTLNDMLHACPDELWRARLWVDPSARPEYAQFWYRVYHALFWLDLYLWGTEEGFAPPAPFALIEMVEDDLPERVYTKAELHAYLEYGREKCQATIEALTDKTVKKATLSRPQNFAEFSVRLEHGHPGDQRRLLRIASFHILRQQR